MKKISEVKYIDAISQNVEDNQKEQRAFDNEDAILHVGGAINETKKALSLAKKELSASQKAIPYNLQAEIDATFKVDDLELALELAERIQKVRF
jgi:LPS O-antigen subunit length determinant protein (WzzB/FepE family)